MHVDGLGLVIIRVCIRFIRSFLVYAAGINNIPAVDAISKVLASGDFPGYASGAYLHHLSMLPNVHGLYPR